MTWWKKLYRSLSQWKGLFWKNPEKLLPDEILMLINIFFNISRQLHFYTFMLQKSAFLINAITSLNYYTIWVFILLLFIVFFSIVFLTWRWVSEYVRSCQSSKPLAWYQKLSLGLHSPQQLCPVELWHIIKLRRNPQVRKGNSSSTAVKFQLARPPRGFWPATFMILYINPSLKT